MSIRLFHGTGGDGEERRSEHFRGVLRPGRMLFTTPDPRAAALYGSKIYEFTLEAREDEILDLNKGGEKRSAAEWLESFGVKKLTPSLARHFWPNFLYHLRHYPNGPVMLAWYELVSEEGDGREYDPEGEAKICSLLRKTLPGVVAVHFWEEYTYSGGEAVYEVFLVPDQLNLNPA